MSEQVFKLEVQMGWTHLEEIFDFKDGEILIGTRRKFFDRNGALERTEERYNLKLTFG